MTAKAWGGTHSVHVHTQSEATATKFDDLLWVYKDISFVPHALLSDNIDAVTPVTIGYSDRFPDLAHVMINLASDIPKFAARFDRIIEIVSGDESTKQQARKRYRQYQKAHYEIHNHKIENLTEHG